MLTQRRKQSDIGHTKSLAGDRESPLQVFRWQAGWQTFGIGGGRPLALQIHTDERRRRSKRLGQMQVTRMFQLSKLETVDEAVAKLLEQA